MRVAVIGRGAIGLTCAYELIKRAQLSVTIFGDHNANFGASRAAGAMLNVVSEVDTFNECHPLTSWKLRNKASLLGMWKELMNDLFKDHLIKRDLMFGKGTQIVMERGATNEVEERSFNAMRSALGPQEHKENQVNKEVDGVDDFLIGDEQSVDSEQFLDGLGRYLATYASNIDANVVRIAKDSDQWIIEVVDGSTYSADSVVLCAGSWSEAIINRSPDLKGTSRRSFYGVGSALLVSSELNYVKQPRVDRIIRTPNRGGTCGIHAVQRAKSLYVGASSVVTDKPLKNPRASSVHALLEGLKNTLSFDVSQLSSKVITGYRPVTDDAVPIIGSLGKGVFCCYGTKRDGFTWSPLFAKFIASEVVGVESVSTAWEELKSYCEPARMLVSAGTVDDCIENYVLNKKFESHQHGKSLSQKEVDDLYLIAQDVHKYAEQMSGKKVGVQPEIVNMFYYVMMKETNAV